MSASVNTKHYTYHLGTSIELNSCLKIVYYKSSDYDKATVSGLKSLTDVLLSKLETGAAGIYCSERDSADVDFDLVTSTYPEVSFDTIIYISRSGNDPLGFTHFLGTQSNIRPGTKISEMKFGFKFSMVNNGVDINLSYTLDPIWSNSEPLLSEYFVTNATELSQISDSGKTTYMRYTDDIRQLESSDNYRIVTDSGLLTKSGSWRAWISPEVSMKRVRDFSNFSVGLWKSDLVIYRWNTDGYYTVDSLTSCNHFGVLDHILDGQVFLGESEHIRTFVSGKVLIDTDTDMSAGYTSLTDGHRFVSDTRRVILDPWDQSERVWIVSKNNTASSLDLRFLENPPGKYYHLLEKRGPWYKFWNQDTDTYCMSGLWGSAYFGASEIDHVWPVSGRLLVKTSESELYVYPFDGTTEYTLGGKPGFTVDLESPGEYRAFLDSIRRRPYRGTSGFGEICESFRGILFYIENNKIYHL